MYFQHHNERLCEERNLQVPTIQLVNWVIIANERNCGREREEGHILPLCLMAPESYNNKMLVTKLYIGM